MTAKEAAQVFGCTEHPIYARLERWDINRERYPKSGYGDHPEITYTDVYYYYVVQELSQSKTADELGVGRRIIRERMRVWGIESRSLSEARSGEKCWVYHADPEDHPCWNRELSEERKQDLAEAAAEANRGVPLSEEHKQAISDSLSEYYEEHDSHWKGVTGEDHPNTGKTVSEETRKKISQTLKGRSLPEETKEKMRKSHIERLETNKDEGNQLKPNFNREACREIDKYGERYGYDFQHAMNGGEISPEGLPYYIDGYDEERNVAIEYYERHHSSQKEYDQNRKDRIMKETGCRFIELWYGGRERVTDYLAV